MYWANALGSRNSSEIMLCFVKNVLQRFMSSTLMSRRNAHAVRGGPTFRTRFSNGSLIAIKLAKNYMCKVHTNSHEIRDNKCAICECKVLPQL